MPGVEVTAYTDRLLLRRRDLDFVVTYDSPQLTREEAADLLSKKLGVSRDRIALVRMAPQFGAKTMKGHCHVYESAEDLREIEAKHIMDRMKGKREKPEEQEKAKAKTKKEEDTG